MYALKVQVNSENPIVAGASDLGVLNAIISCVGKLGEGASQAKRPEDTDIFLSIGGLTSRNDISLDEHLRWASNKALLIGDVVRVEVVQAVEAHSPVVFHEPLKSQHDEREYFEHCKQVYFELREKYEI